MIEVRKLKKYFAGTTAPAVDEVTFSINRGNICVFVGPSGCGKTTILKMINRLEEPTSGSIHIEGKDISQADACELRRNIGYVIQQIGLLPHRTIADNVALVPRLLKWPESKIKDRINTLLELVGLDPAETEQKYPHQLSGGQMQRVGVARALAADPPIMLMDEPFGAVDPIVRNHLQDEFIKLQSKVKKTICFVTHDMNEALKMGDFIIVLNQGRMVQKGTPLELLSSPANQFVKDLIGDDRGVKLLDITKAAAIMSAVDRGNGKTDPANGSVKDDAPVKNALEEMMRNNCDSLGVYRDGALVGTLSWPMIKNHINKISGERNGV